MEGDRVSTVQGLSQGALGDLILLQVQNILDLLVELVGYAKMSVHIDPQ